MADGNGIIGQYAQHLERKATRLVRVWTAVCAVLGAALGGFPLVYHSSNAVVPAHLGMATLLLGLLAGGYVGYTTGQRRAFEARLQLQMLVRQWQMEQSLLSRVAAPPPAPVAVAPVAPAPVAPVAPPPVAAAPAPVPVAPAPVAPSPVAPAPVSPVPVAPVPLSPAPVVVAPVEAAPAPPAPTPLPPAPALPVQPAPAPLSPPPAVAAAPVPPPVLAPAPPLSSAGAQ